MNKLKRLMAVSMAIVMSLSMFACSKKTDDKTSAKTDNDVETICEYDETKYNAPGEFPIFKEKQTISVQLPQSTYVEDYNTNTMTTMLEEDLNADLVFQTIPSKEYKTKVNLMVAAGGDELSDAVLGAFSDAEVLNYALNDVIADVTDYYYNTGIAYYLNQDRENVGWNFFPQVTMPDNKIYGVASLNEAISNAYPDKMWVFTPWLDAVGMKEEDIKTADDFKNMLIAFRDKDPNGNGKKDEIGLTSVSTSKCWFNYLMNSFVYAGDENYMVVEDGELSFAYQKDAWKDGLKYMKSLYDEGLINEGAFSQDSASFKSLLNNPTTVVGSFAAVGPGTIASDDERRVQYSGIAPLENTDGVKLGSYTPATASTRLVISKKAKDIENTFRFGDLLVSKKYSLMQRYGEEGVDYTLATDTDKSMYESLGYKAVLKEILPWSTLQNKHWCQTGPYIREKSISAGVVWSGNPLDHNRVIAEAQIKYEDTAPEEYVTKLIFNSDESDTATDKLQSLEDYVSEMNANFITGVNDIDKDWQAFQDQLEAIGTEEVLQLSQAAYDRLAEASK